MFASPDMSNDPKVLQGRVESAWSAPIGAASPLWLMFAGAASAGVAFWWLTRWRAAAPTHLEAVLAPPAPELEPVVAAIAAPVAEPVAVVEAEIEAVTPEPVVEAAAGPAIDATAEPEPKPKAAVRTKPRAADA